MALNVSLTQLSSLANDTTATTKVNNNSTAISTVLVDGLSRSGVAPNQMGTVLDMNNNAILNLPPPMDQDQPVRLQDLYLNGKINLSLGNIVCVEAFGGVPNTGADMTSKIQAALNSGATLVMIITPGTWTVSGQLTIPGGVHFMGTGKYTTILKKASPSSSVNMFNLINTGTQKGIEITDMTLDCNSLTNSCPIQGQYLTGFRARRLYLKNFYVWGIAIGYPQSATSSTIVNSNLILEDITTSNALSTYEHILIYNSQDITIRDSVFNGSTNDHGVGIYQCVENITVENNRFTGFTTYPLYYSLSTNRISIINNKFDDNASVAITGSNQSDNGTFGNTYVDGLLISGNRFSLCGAAMYLGAITNAIVVNNLIESCTTGGIYVDQGNGLTTPEMAKNINITGNIIRNNNTGNVASELNPGILFNIGSATGTYNLNANISNNNIYDDQVSPTQNYPIVFYGNVTWGNINILGNRLAPYNGASGITYGNSGSAGGTVNAANNLGD